ncbi:MAG: cysteine desulfurase [Candidatus Peribacteraceae bacterium]
MPSIHDCRRLFPSLSESLVFLDSAATTQKPQMVIDALIDAYRDGIANPGRGVYPLAERVTSDVHAARVTVAEFIGAKTHEIVFTKGTTEAINLVARTLGETLQAGDRVAVTMMEHHSNLVPWLQLRERRGIEIDWIPVNKDGQTDMNVLLEMLKKGKTKLLAITGLSNVLGIAPDLSEIIRRAHECGALVLVDAAQMVAHLPIDVRALDADFLAFSGHKIYGPMGVGVLYGKELLLEKMPTFLGGGDMVQSVTTKGYTSAELPRKFEAGTISAVDVIGLGVAISWLDSIGMDAVMKHDRELMSHAMKRLKEIDGLQILGSQKPDERTGVISFTVNNVHPHDLTHLLGERGICLRAGHHCAEPLHNFLKINASARMSFGVYNTKEDIDTCAAAIAEATKFLQK